MGTIYLGSDLQPIRAIFDTGSANSWILSKQAIQGKNNEEEFHPFEPSSSKTFSFFEPKKFASITFGSGPLEGEFARDQVTLGSNNLASGCSLNVKDYEFGLVEKQDVFNSEFDAIIGMAYPTMSVPGVTPFFDNIIHKKVLHDKKGNPANIFAFYMSTNQVD